MAVSRTYPPPKLVERRIKEDQPRRCTNPLCHGTGRVSFASGKETEIHRDIATCLQQPLCQVRLHGLDRFAAHSVIAIANDTRDTQNLAMEALSQRLETEYGVDVDEEMARLMELQNAYAANARVLSSIQDLLNRRPREVEVNVDEYLERLTAKT